MLGETTTDDDALRRLYPGARSRLPVAGLRRAADRAEEIAESLGRIAHASGTRPTRWTRAGAGRSPTEWSGGR